MIGSAAFNGVSEMISNVSEAVVTFLYNIILMKMVGQEGVAAITIVLYAQFLFNAMFLGFSMGVAPVISYQYGAQKEKEVEKVFEKGYTGENGRRYSKSTGIGLYLCKKLCIKLGLDIQIKSKLDVGTKVNIIFPVSNFNLVNDNI